MIKSDRPSLHKTLALAAAVAALGTSVGATLQQAWAESPQVPAASQLKITRERGGDVNQMKFRAEQDKVRKAKGAQNPTVGRPGMKDPAPVQTLGGGNMLNPQPLPPKGASGAPGELLPARKQ